MIDGIKAEPTDPRNGRGIEVLSWSWSLSDSGNLTGPGRGEADKVIMQDIHFVRHVGPASPQLMRASASGERFATAVLTTRTPAGVLAVTLENTMVSSYTASGTETDPRVERFTLGFSAMKMEYGPATAA